MKSEPVSKTTAPTINIPADLAARIQHFLVRALDGAEEAPWFDEAYEVATALDAAIESAETHD